MIKIELVKWAKRSETAKGEHRPASFVLLQFPRGCDLSHSSGTAPSRSGRSQLTWARYSPATRQPSARLACSNDGVELGMLVHEAGVDLMLDQIRRHLVEIRRVYDDAEQALGGCGREGRA